MEWTVGKIVRFKTVSGDNVEGEVFGYDSGAKVVALRIRHPAFARLRTYCGDGMPAAFDSPQSIARRTAR